MSLIRQMIRFTETLTCCFVSVGSDGHSCSSMQFAGKVVAPLWGKSNTQSEQTLDGQPNTKTTKYGIASWNLTRQLIFRCTWIWAFPRIRRNLKDLQKKNQSSQTTCPLRLDNSLLVIYCVYFLQYNFLVPLLTEDSEDRLLTGFNALLKSTEQRCWAL